jgi:hypothetical protein
MHAVRLIVAGSAASGLLLGSPSQAQQQQPDDRYQIRLSVGGVPVPGSQELLVRINGKPRPEQDAVLSEPWPELARGQKSQLVVKVTDPNGVTTNYTKGNRISFEHFGCLTINKNGVMTVTPSGTCSMPDAPVLLVGYYDSTGKPVTYSEFLFKVRP